MNQKDFRYIKFLDGLVYWDNRNHAVYIPPKDSFNKDIVYAKSFVEGDILVLSSLYKKSIIEDVTYNFKGEKIYVGDSIMVSLKNDRLNQGYPLGFVTINIINGVKENSYDILRKKDIKIPVKSKDSLGVNLQVLASSKSKTTYFSFSELRDTLIISFDYLTPREMERYTFINDTINLK